MTPTQNYIDFTSNFIQTMMKIIGPVISLDVSSKVKGLNFDSSGKVSTITADPNLVVRDLQENFSELSPAVTYMLIDQCLEKYPEVKSSYTYSLPKVSLICSLPKLKN